MGESKLKLAKREEMLMSCSGVQTMAGRVQVRWESESAATPMGQLAYFIEFLNLTGLWSRWLESCPLACTSPNAPTKADVLGTWLLSILAGHRRYAHVTAIRCDGINPGLLGMGTRRHTLIALLVAAVGATGWLLLRTPDAAPEFMHPITTAPEPPKPAGPPWLYGRIDARFTVVGYADLECPYCRAYFPMLQRWIDVHPEVNWQWHHLPLSMDEPAATAGARLAECAGKTGGHAAFWKAVAWLYSNTRSDGHGLPEGLRYPDLTPTMQGCLDSDRPDAVIRAQAVEAAQQGIAATPTLQLRDRESGKALLLHGPIEGDALLSAIDLLAAGSTTVAEPAHSPDMPTGVAGDMPRWPSIFKAAARLVRVDRNPFASHPLTRTATASAVVDARSSPVPAPSSPGGFALQGQAPSDLIHWRFAMSLVVADSRPESLTLIAAQHEDWIIRQAITLLENRAVVSPRQQKMNQGAVYTDYGGQIDKTLPNIVTRGASDLGLTVGSLGFFPAMDVVRQALPMVLTMLKMALVICIPLVLLIGTYDLKTVVTVSCIQFALFFVDFWFQLARWLDSTILDALYGWGFGADRPHANFDPLILKT